MMRQNLESAEETNKHYLPVLISGGDLSKSASELSFNSETNARHHSIAMASSVSNMTLLDPLDHTSRVQSSMECGDLACEDGGSQVITIHENESEASCSPCSNNTPDSSTNGSAWKLRVKFWPWFRHYVFDWVLTLVIFILAGSLLSTGWPVEPHLRYLAPSDPSLSMPLVQKETVPTWLLFTLCAFLPLAVFAVTQCFVKSGKDFHHAVLGLLEALSLTLLFTDVFKLYAGFYRPNWFQACNPGLDGVCQTPYSKTLDFRMSFPSGHSSLSFAGLVFLAMYLSGKLNLFGKHGGQLWKLLIVLTPLGLAGFVAVSRVVDYFHHPVDIVAGSMLGGTIGMLCYLMFYPSPFAPSACGVPKTRAPCISE